MFSGLVGDIIHNDFRALMCPYPCPSRFAQLATPFYFLPVCQFEVVDPRAGNPYISVMVTTLVNSLTAGTPDVYVEEAFPNLRAGMSEVVFSNGSFSCVHLIEYLLEFTGPAYVDCATWCAGTSSLRMIENFLECQIIDFRLVIDGGAANVMRKDGFQKQVIDRFGEKSVVRMYNHSKFFLVYNQKWRFVVLTSANFNKNNKMEFFNVFESAEMCGEMIRIVNEIFASKDRYSMKGVLK